MAKDVPRLVECLIDHLVKACYGRTARFTTIAFGNADYPTRLSHALVFLQEFWPIPRTQITPAKALVDHVKEIDRKFKHAKRIHGAKVDAVADSLGIGLCLRILHHLATDIY